MNQIYETLTAGQARLLFRTLQRSDNRKLKRLGNKIEETLSEHNSMCLLIEV